MTNKRKRAYEIIIISLVAILMSLCAYMGITAIQKSMTLNLKFNATPQIYCKLAVGETVLFDNKTLEVHPLSTLSGNTLTFDASVFSSDLGVTTFNLTITNYSTTLNDIGVTFENATISNNANNSNVITLGNSETLQITPTGIVEVTMKKVVPITLGLTGVSINYAESNLFEDGGHYAPIGENLKIVIALEDNYGNPQYSLGGNSQGTVSGNTITIDSSNISAGVNLNIQAQQQTYTIIFNGNGATSGSMADEMFNIGISYNLPANTFAKTEHNFTGWKDSAGNSYTDKQSVKDLAGAGETITLTAQWQVKTYTLTYTVTNTECSSHTAIIVTNDTSFSVIYGNETTSFQSSDVDATTFDFSSGYNITPVTNAHKGKNNYFYKEKYHSLTVDGTASGSVSFTVPAGCKIFIFWINATGSNMGIDYFKLTPTINQSISVYYKTYSNQATTTTNPIEQETARVFEFYMPSCDLSVDTKTWTSSQHSGGGND